MKPKTQIIIFLVWVVVGLVLLVKSLISFQFYFTSIFVVGIGLWLFEKYQKHGLKVLSPIQIKSK